jgi:Flp pilus assembly protein TadD
MKNVRQVAMGGLVAWAMFAGAGCGPKTREITDLQRKEAAHLASDAQFALTVRDFSRAETSLARAVELTPDDGALWVSLGATRVRQGNRDGAKVAYEGALRAYEDEAKETRTDSEPWLKQVYVLSLLGRTDEARKRLEKAAKQFPESRNVRLFVEGKQLERMLADPKFKEMAL